MRSLEIIKWRKANNCSQGILASILGVDVNTISRWERGIQKIPSFLHFALRQIEEQGHIVSDAIEMRTETRRADAERRTIERRIMEKTVISNKRTIKRRTSARRAVGRRVADGS